MQVMNKFTKTKCIKQLERAVEIIGGQSKTARLLSVAQQTVWSWLNVSQQVPARHVLKIEKLTGFVVSRNDLRPDLYPKE